MIIQKNRSSLFLLLCLFLSPITVYAFQQDGCGSGNCIDCHKLNKKEAADLFAVPEKNIIDLKLSEVPGLWEVDIRQEQKVIPVFLDFSKQYMISGSVIKITDKKNITSERFTDLNRIDVSLIPLNDALIVGNSTAEIKIIVFDDPKCSYCAKFQLEMKRIVKERPDIAFYIKMFPLKSHPGAYEAAKSIVCANSLALLEESLAGKEINQPSCETDQIDRNLELAAKIGIHSTPTLVFPDGRIIPGYKTMENIITLLGKSSNNQKTKH